MLENYRLEVSSFLLVYYDCLLFLLCFYLVYISFLFCLSHIAIYGFAWFMIVYVFMLVIIVLYMYFSLCRWYFVICVSQWRFRVGLQPWNLHLYYNPTVNL